MLICILETSKFSTRSQDLKSVGGFSQAPIPFWDSRLKVSSSRCPRHPLRSLKRVECRACSARVCVLFSRFLTPNFARRSHLVRLIQQDPQGLPHFGTRPLLCLGALWAMRGVGAMGGDDGLAVDCRDALACRVLCDACCVRVDLSLCFSLQDLGQNTCFLQRPESRGDLPT